MTQRPVPDLEEIEREDHEIERSSHAIYGLIIITSSLVADRAVADDALTSLLVLWGAGAVLVLAHLYSATLAEVGEKGRWLTYKERHLLIADNITVIGAVVAPTILLLGAALGWISLTIALDIAIILSISALFVVGAYQSRKQGGSPAVQLGLGALGGLIGIVVILVEVTLTH